MNDTLPKPSKRRKATSAAEPNCADAAVDASRQRTHFETLTYSFIQNHPPGKLAKNLLRLILALMEYRINHGHRILISDFNNDLSKLIGLLELAEQFLLEEAEDPTSSSSLAAETNFYDEVLDFTFCVNLPDFNRNLCFLILDFVKYELPAGYPIFLNSVLPHIMALFEWLDEASKKIDKDLNPQE